MATVCDCLWEPFSLQCLQVIAWNSAGLNSSARATDGMFIGLSEIELDTSEDTGVLFDVISADPDAPVPPIQARYNETLPLILRRLLLFELWWW